MAKNNDKNQNKNSQNRQQESADRVGRLNEERRQAEIAAAEEKKKKEEKEQAEEKPNAVNTATARLLKGAWEYLFYSFGATFLWIDIHVFLGIVFGHKLFCKLGREWVPDEIKRAHPDLAEKIGQKAGFWEGIGVALINLALLIYIFWILMINGMILKIVANPLDAFAALIGWMWGGSGITTFSK